VGKLEQTVATYTQRTGHPPASFTQMAREGVMPGIPLDPLGVPYSLTSDGHVVVQDPDNLPFIQKGLPPGYVPPAKPKFLPTD
jgi:hypothetical protein